MWTILSIGLTFHGSSYWDGLNFALIGLVFPEQVFIFLLIDLLAHDDPVEVLLFLEAEFGAVVDVDEGLDIVLLETGGVGRGDDGRVERDVFGRAEDSVEGEALEIDEVVDPDDAAQSAHSDGVVALLAHAGRGVAQ